MSAISSSAIDRWDLHVAVVEAEIFDTRGNSKAYKGELMRAKSVSVVKQFGPLSWHFHGPNINIDGEEGKRTVVYDTTKEELIERCPETYKLVVQAASDLVSKINEDAAHAIQQVKEVL
jgi:hypothetical protein